MIDVYDLGVLADQMSKVVSLKQRDLDEKLQMYLGISREQSDLQIESILHVPYSQSQQRHLMLLTKSGERIYLRFELREAPLPSDLQVENKGLQ